MARRWKLRSVVVVVAGLLVAACGSAASPTPAPTPPRIAVPAGIYTAGAFKPAVTYTLPAGWLVAGDEADYFAAQPITTDLLGVYLFRSPRPASQDLDCPVAAVPGVGTTAKDLVDWIRARPGLVAGDPTPVTVGNLTGLQVDVAIIDGWKASCPFAKGIPTVPLFVGATDASFRWVVSGTERLRLHVLDVPGNGTVVVDIDAFDGPLMGGFLGDATSVVTSMGFGSP